MQKSLIIFTLGLSLLLSACTTPITTETGRAIQDEAIYNHDIFIPDDTKETVTFLRDSGFLGSGCNYYIYINGRKDFYLSQKRYAKIYLTPNTYVFALGLGGGLCTNGQYSITSTLEKGKPQVYRLSPPQSVNSQPMIRIK